MQFIRHHYMRENNVRQNQGIRHTHTHTNTHTPASHDQMPYVREKKSSGGWGEILNYLWCFYCCSSISQVFFGEAVCYCVIESYYGHSCAGTIYAQICKKMMASQNIVTLLLKQKLFSFTSFLPLTDHLKVSYIVLLCCIFCSFYL